MVLCQRNGEVVATAALELSGKSIAVRSTDFSWLVLILPDKNQDLVGKRLWEKLFCSTTTPQLGALEARFQAFSPERVFGLRNVLRYWYLK
jgi:hypothetical protein